MSELNDRLAAGLSNIIKLGGTPIRIQYFVITTGSIFDDDTTFTQSGGDLWTSGVIFPLSNTPGHSDSILLEQGKLIHTDSRLFIHGSLILAGSEMSVKITVGSPSNVDTNYSIIPPGPTVHYASNTPIYKVVYIRKIGGVGSMLGEI